MFSIYNLGIVGAQQSSLGALTSAATFENAPILSEVALGSDHYGLRKKKWKGESVRSLNSFWWGK